MGSSIPRGSRDENAGILEIFTMKKYLENIKKQIKSQQNSRTFKRRERMKAKISYTSAELEIVRLEVSDLIATSAQGGSDDWSEDGSNVDSGGWT